MEDSVTQIDLKSGIATIQNVQVNMTKENTQLKILYIICFQSTVNLMNGLNGQSVQHVVNQLNPLEKGQSLRNQNMEELVTQIALKLKIAILQNVPMLCHLLYIWVKILFITLQ